MALFTLVASGSAYADECSGRDHTTGTVIGAVGGAAIGGVASHNAGGAVVGGVLGGLAGNAIARSEDCNRQAQYRSGGDQQGYQRQDGYQTGQQQFAYPRGYNVAPDENDYWGVESHQDFGADYSHIWQSIQRGREDGTFTRYQARRYTQQLQHIRDRADRQERRGRFDPQDIEAQLSELRRTMYVARREDRDNGSNGDYGRR